MGLELERWSGVDREVGYDMRNRMDYFGVLVYLLGSRAHYLASLPAG